MATKSPNPTDKHVGNRVRMRRMMLGMGQTKLADALGIAFQQVQKYERGINRIGAGRLQQIAHILQVPVQFFFEGLPLPSESRRFCAASSAPWCCHTPNESCEFMKTTAPLRYPAPDIKRINS